MWLLCTISGFSAVLSRGTGALREFSQGKIPAVLSEKKKKETDGWCHYGVAKLL